jgi:hypothetical protein
MTDIQKPDAPDEDIDARIAHVLAEYEAHDQRSAALWPANKAALFGALGAAGITTVTVTFDGYGDSGQIERITAQQGDRVVDLPAGQVSLSSAIWNADAVSTTDAEIEAAIEQLCYDLLRQSHPGWENNDGAYGDFVFDVAAGTITLDYAERYTATQSYSHDF